MSKKKENKVITKKTLKVLEGMEELGYLGFDFGDDASLKLKNRLEEILRMSMTKKEWALRKKEALYM